MKPLLIWSLLAGLALCIHQSESKSLEAIQGSFGLHIEEDISDSWPTLQRRTSSRKGITRSPSAPNLQCNSPLCLSKEPKGNIPFAPPRIRTRPESLSGPSRLLFAPNLDHDTGSHQSEINTQKSLQDPSPRIRAHPEVPAGSSPVSSYRTPFSSVPGSPSSSPRHSTPASTQPVGSSEQMFTRLKIKSDPRSETDGKPPQKGIASQIGKQLLWVQNNPTKAMRIGASMTANAASGGAAIAAAHHNVPIAACLGIASAVMKVGIDCYDGRDKVQTWHKQKGIDPRENVEATKRVVEAAKKPVSSLWRTISRPMSSQQSLEKPWPIDNLPVRKRSTNIDL